MKTALNHQQPGLASHFGPPHLMQLPHCHDDIELNFVETGSLIYLFGEKKVRVETGQLALFWATMPHQLIEFPADTRMYWLHLPLASFLRWQLPAPLNDAILNGQLLVDRERVNVERDRVLFDQWNEDLESGLPVQSGIVLLEIEARLRRLALKAPLETIPKEEVTLRKSSQAPGKVEQMASFILANYTGPLKIEQIAHEVGLHTNYAMTLFRQAYGMTMNQYIVRYRVLHAQRLLATTDRKILEIALEAGFESLSGFYAAFENICEVTPRQYRASLF